MLIPAAAFLGSIFTRASAHDFGLLPKLTDSRQLKHKKT